jgi:hypothetical protein
LKISGTIFDNKFGTIQPINTNNNFIIKIKHFFLIKSDLRDKNNVQREKKKEKRSCLFWGLNPRPSVSIQLTVVLAYLSTLQSGSNALRGSYLKTIN